MPASFSLYCINLIAPYSTFLFMRIIWPSLFIGGILFLMGAYTDIIDYFTYPKGTNIAFTVFQVGVIAACITTLIILCRNWNKRSQQRNVMMVMASGFVFMLCYMMSTVF